MSESNSGVEGGGSNNSPVSSADKEVMTDEIKKKLALFDRLNSEYERDPVAKTVLSKILNGETNTIGELFANKIEAKKEEIVKAASDGSSSSEINELKAQLAQMQEVVKGVKNFVETDKIIGARSGIEGEYQNQFNRLAKEAGYEKDFTGYDELYDFARLESQKLARKYGLVVKDSNGNEVPDILLNYNKDLLKEAFDLANSRMSKLNFDVLEAKRKVIEDKNYKEKKQFQESALELLGKAKTRGEKKEVYNQLFKNSLRQKGLSLSDL